MFKNMKSPTGDSKVIYDSIDDLNDVKMTIITGNPETIPHWNEMIESLKHFNGVMKKIRFELSKY